MATKNNAKKQRKQRETDAAKQVGGVTGKGFMPGQSGNPAGRPPGTARGLLKALEAKVRAPQSQDGPTYEQLLVDALVEEALRGRNRLAAIGMIFDRLEGRPLQAVRMDGRLDLSQEERRKRITEILEMAAARCEQERDEPR